MKQIKNVKFFDLGYQQVVMGVAFEGCRRKQARESDCPGWNTAIYGADLC